VLKYLCTIMDGFLKKSYPIPSLSVFLDYNCGQILLLNYFTNLTKPIKESNLLMMNYKYK